MTERIIIRDEQLRQRAIDMLANLALDKPVEVIVQPYRKRRSLSQNNLYSLWCDQIADETGNDRDTVRYELRRRFAPMKAVVLGSDIKMVPKSTAELNTAEMLAYMDKVAAFAATELGIRLMVPEMANAP